MADLPPPRVTWALGAILAAGALLRLLALVASPSLSVDEAMLGLNIATRSCRGLLRPLDYSQTAPPLFLCATRLVTRVLGVNATALRLLPLAAGLALPAVVWSVARRLVGVWASLLCAALAACSALLVQFSTVAKPYALDALVTGLVLRCTLDTIDAPEEAGPWRCLLAVGIAGVALSAPAILALGGSGVALLARSGVRRARAAPRRLATLAALWGGAFALTYALWYRGPATSAFMQQFWAGAFLPWRPLEALPHAWRTLREEVFPLVVGNTVPQVPTVAFCALAAAGARALARRRGAWAGWLLVAPFAFAVAASLLHRYPLAARTLLFAAPLLILLLVAGFEWAATAFPAAPRLGARVFGALALLWVATAAEITLVHPDRPPDVRALVGDLGERQAGAAVYVFAGGLATWTFYTTDWSAPDTARLARAARLGAPSGPAFGNAPGRGHAVQGEGAGLVFPRASGAEILGVPTGIQVRYATGPTQEGPDPGWVENEARRIARQARPDVWLFFEAYFRDRPVVELLDALERAGGRRVYEHSVPGAALYEYRFDARGPR